VRASDTDLGYDVTAMICSTVSAIRSPFCSIARRAGRRWQRRLLAALFFSASISSTQCERRARTSSLHAKLFAMFGGKLIRQILPEDVAHGGVLSFTFETNCHSPRCGSSRGSVRVTKQQQQQPQNVPQMKCESCGGTRIFDSPISDPATRLTYHLHRCRDCGHIRWPEQTE
jgi:hypothetical protein